MDVECEWFLIFNKNTEEDRRFSSCNVAQRRIFVKQMKWFHLLLCIKIHPFNSMYIMLENALKFLKTNQCMIDDILMMNT